jgi:predicted nucleic acid-binding protein
MATQLLIDTDVLIDYLRDYPDAVSYVEAQQERLLISVVTVAELYAGVREGEERSRLERFLRAFEIIPLDQRVAIQGGLYRRDYSKSHNVGLADALIAATATQRQVPLVTLNRKHFPMLQDVFVPYHKAQPNPAPNTYEDSPCQETNYPYERFFSFFSAFRVPVASAIGLVL